MFSPIFIIAVHHGNTVMLVYQKSPPTLRNTVNHCNDVTQTISKSLCAGDQQFVKHQFSIVSYYSGKMEAYVLAVCPMFPGLGSTYRLLGILPSVWGCH